MSRATIRAAFKAAIQTTFSGLVFDTRVTDLRDLPESVCVYFTSGAVEDYLSFSETKAEIVVEYSKQNGTDSELDVVADRIIDAIRSSALVKAEVKNPKFTGFEYQPNDDGNNTIKLTFDILY